MSTSADKKKRKEFRKQFQIFIDQNKQLAMEEALRIVMAERFFNRLRFCIAIMRRGRRVK